MYQRYKALESDFTSTHMTLLTQQDTTTKLESSNRALIHDVSDLKRQLDEQIFVKSKCKEQSDALALWRDTSEQEHASSLREMADSYEKRLQSMTMNHSQVI